MLAPHALGLARNTLFTVISMHRCRAAHSVDGAEVSVQRDDMGESARIGWAPPQQRDGPRPTHLPSHCRSATVGKREPANTAPDLGERGRTGPILDPVCPHPAWSGSLCTSRHVHCGHIVVDDNQLCKWPNCHGAGQERALLHRAAQLDTMKGSVR